VRFITISPWYPIKASRRERSWSISGIAVWKSAAAVAALSGWRRELFGEKALALKHGRLALAVDRNRVIAVEREG